MPLIYRKNTGNGTLLVWRVTESEEQLSSLVTQGDRAAACEFRSAARRLERLAWRAALREVTPHGEVLYTSEGAPYIGSADGTAYLGVAHTEGLAVVLISSERCAVDTESVGRDMSKMECRFISSGERALADAGRPDFAVAVWCAKETLYKYSGRRGLDFTRDLRIIGSDIERGIISGCICGGESVTMRVLRTGDHIITYTF